MSVIRLLNNGSWNKLPLLTAARRILMDGLAGNCQKTELGDLATFVNGTSYDRGLLADGGTPIIRISNMTDPRSEYLTTTQSFGAKYMVQPNDLLVSWSASFKTVIWPGPTGVLNQHIFKVTEKPGNHRGFVRHAIEAVFDDMQSKVVGIGMMHLRRKDFLGYPVPAPSRVTQEAVSRYLDWIENPDGQPEPSLPARLSEQRRIVARIEKLAARIEEARGLRRQAVAETDAFVSSLHVHSSQPEPIELSELLELDEEKEAIQIEGTYPQVGVRGFGQGLFSKEAVDGSQTTYKAFNCLYEGSLVLSQVKGWEGAIAVCPPALAGRYVSPEYRTFRCISGRLLPEYMSALVATPWFWRQLKTLTRGVGARRERTRPEQFLRMRIPMPSLKLQEQAVSMFRDLEDMKRLQAETTPELDALLPSVLDRAFKGKL